MAQFPNASIASGKWSLRQQYRSVLGYNWPLLSPPIVEILVVGGGGGGGFDMGGGGGGGAVSAGTMLVQPGAYTLTIGAGGLGNGAGINGNGGAHVFTNGSVNGSDTSIFSPSYEGIISKGGGFGGSSYWDHTLTGNPSSGGNGGGASGYSNGTAAGGRLGGASTQHTLGLLDGLLTVTSGGFGYIGGYGGPQYYPAGGAGAGANGTNSPNTPHGGIGLLNAITGVSYYWGGGGGGGVY